MSTVNLQHGPKTKQIFLCFFFVDANVVGWDPDHITVNDGGAPRKLKLFSREWRNWEVYSPIYGSLRDYEAFEKQAEDLFGATSKTQDTESIIEQMGAKPLNKPLPLGVERPDQKKE